MHRIYYRGLRAAALLLMLPPPGFAQPGTALEIAKQLATQRADVITLRELYVGEWSNGRGETLVITGSTIKFGSDRAVPYRDVTRVTNGREFHLEITSEA